MPTFKDKELEQLSQRILGRAVGQQQPAPGGRVAQVTIKRKPTLPKVLRRRI